MITMMIHILLSLEKHNHEVYISMPAVGEKDTEGENK